MTEPPPPPPEQPGEPGQPPQPGYGPPPPGYVPPPGYGPPPPNYLPPPGYGAAPTPSSTPMVLGIIGIVAAFCCSPLAIGLGIASYVQASRQPGGNTALGIIAVVLGVAFLLLNILSYAIGGFGPHGFFFRVR